MSVCSPWNKPFICFQYLESVCTNHKTWVSRMFLSPLRMRHSHTHKQHAATIFFQCCVAFKAALIAELVLRPDTLEVHAEEKVKDRREHFTPGGCWTLQTCLNSPVMLFSTIRSFPTDIPAWLEGSSTVFLSFLFTSPPLMCLVSHFWHSCLFRSLELTCRASPGHKPGTLALSSSCVSESAMAWLSVYCQCG